MTQNATALRVLQRNLKTVYINPETLAWNEMHTSDNDLEFQIVRPNLDKVNEAVGGIFMRRGLDETESLLVYAIKNGEAARETLEKWRADNNRPERPDNDVPPLDQVAFMREINREKLRRALRSPSERDLGTLDNLGDLESVLLDAINTIFNLEPVQDEAVKPVSDEVAETFPEGAGDGIGRPVETLWEPAVVVVGTTQDEPASVQRGQSHPDPLPDAGDVGHAVADAIGRPEMG